MMERRHWVQVRPSTDLGEGERQARQVEAQRVLLLRRKGAVYAVENECPHLGCTFARGAFEGFMLTCPCHDWVFDIRTGAFVQAPEIALRTFACREEAGAIWIELGGESNG